MKTFEYEQGQMDSVYQFAARLGTSPRAGEMGGGIGASIAHTKELSSPVVGKGIEADLQWTFRRTCERDPSQGVLAGKPLDDAALTVPLATGSGAPVSRARG